jgi:hypothetical protein
VPDFAFRHLVLAKSLTVPKAAAKYGVDPRTMRRWCEGGFIGIRVGGCYRVSVPWPTFT